MKYFLTFLISIVTFTGANAQFDKTYEPIEINSPLPVEYFFDITGRSQQVANSQDIIDKKIAEKLYFETITRIQELILDGYILYNDTLSNYVNKVAQKAFVSNPTALNGIRIYVSRFPYVNAFTYPDGTILVNAGMLGLLETEAQLAFILAHEVGHYNKKHTLVEYQKKIDLTEQRNDTEDDKLFFLSLSYSREQESEADAYAINIIRNSEYNATQSTPALMCLTREDVSIIDPVADFMQLFNSENFKLDSLWLSVKKTFSSYTSGEKKTIKSVFRGDEDNISTHPSMEKRIISMQEILKSTEYSDEGKKKNIVVNDFEQIHDLAQFENAEFAYNDGEYFLSICVTSHLLKKYPNNEFLLSLMLKNLYWTAYYKDVNSLDHLEKDLPIFLRGRYFLIGHLFNKMGAADTKKMAYGFAKKYQKSQENNDEFFFYLAMSVDQFLGKETAIYFYDQYRTKFSNGKYISVVNQKIK
jgi:Zn-dependent protease with chaperone function